MPEEPRCERADGRCGTSRRDLISAWMRALDAAWRATHAALEDGDLTAQEAQRLEQRLRAERIGTRREVGTISGFPYPEWALAPMRSDIANATIATATKEECHDCHAHDGPRSGPPPEASVERAADEYVVRLAVPGFARQELEVEVTGRRVTMRGDQLETGIDEGPFRLHERLEARSSPHSGQRCPLRRSRLRT